ncbi:hypothetical protein XavaCFBP5823_14085 [Xanthomonas axonopodis pv. vasculorum]|nr:hypothetical protein XavaCFBP5823_14085 [Xanthomonas axonopodis pv. vasculorum]
MTNVSCKERKARRARVHEVARFNQTFYPYACVLFSADCAVRKCTAAREITVIGPAVGTCLAGLRGRPCRRCRRRRDPGIGCALCECVVMSLDARCETGLAYHGHQPATENPA